MEIRGDKAYYLPPVAHNFRGITFLRNGLYLGDLKKNRFEPSQPLALAIRKDEAEAVISLSASDERITRYLKGETLNIEPEEAAHKKGWHLLCADGYPIGFGKLVNQILKKQYTGRVARITRAYPCRIFEFTIIIFIPLTAISLCAM